mgnify:CR=1 FL=1
MGFAQRFWSVCLICLQSLTLSVEEFDAYVSQLLKMIVTILGNDKDMSKMYLTRHARQVTSHDASEIEFMLESFVDQLTELQNSTAKMKIRINNGEEFMRISVDSQRNKFLKYNLFISLSTMCISVASLGCSAFGMNLINGLEETPYAFAFVCTMLGLTVLFIFSSGMVVYARSIDTLKLIRGAEGAVRIFSKKLLHRKFLTIRTITNKTILVEATLQDKVGHIKHILYERDGVPIEQQKLVCRGKVLENSNQTLEEYGVESGNTIMMVLLPKKEGKD